MLIGFHIKGRNGHMLRFRENLGLTQVQAAEMAGVNGQCWCMMETMHLGNCRVSFRSIRKVAALLDVAVEDIYPEEMRGQNARLDKTFYSTMSANRLSAIAATERLCLPSPADVVELRLDSQDMRRRVREFIGKLPYRAREIVKLRYGLDDQGEGYTYTLDEIGKIFRVSQECIRLVLLPAKRAIEERFNMTMEEIVALIDLGDHFASEDEDPE